MWQKKQQYKNKQKTYKQTTTKNTTNQQTKENNIFFLDVSTFQIVLYYAFGEINLYIFKL